MNITDFVKNMNKTFKKYDVKFVANYADVYDSVAVFIKCKEPHIVADYLYDNHFKGVIGTNIGILNNEIVITFFDFSEYSSNEIERLIIDAIFDANAKYKLFEGKNTMKKSLIEKELKMDVWEWGDVKGTDEELCNHIAEYAEEKGIEYMEITEDEFEYLKKDYLKKYKSMKESRFPKLDEFKKFCETDDRIVRCEWEELGEYTIYCEKGTNIEELADYMSDEFDGIYILNNNGSLVQYNRKYPHFEFLFRFHESKKSIRKSMKENINSFDKAIAKKYNGTEPNSAGQYYLDWRFDLKDEMDNIEMLADKFGVKVEFQSDDGYFEVFEESKKSAKKSMKEEMDTSVVGTNKDKTKKYAYDFLKEWYDKIVVESLINDDGDYVLKVGFYDDTLKKRPDVMDIVSAKLSGNNKFVSMLDNDTACKLVVYDVNNPRKYEVYWL